MNHKQLASLVSLRERKLQRVVLARQAAARELANAKDLHETAKVQETRVKLEADQLRTNLLGRREQPGAALGSAFKQIEHADIRVLRSAEDVAQRMVTEAGANTALAAASARVAAAHRAVRKLEILRDRFALQSKIMSNVLAEDEASDTTTKSVRGSNRHTGNGPEASLGVQR